MNKNKILSHIKSSWPVALSSLIFIISAIFLYAQQNESEALAKQLAPLSKEIKSLKDSIKKFKKGLNKVQNSDHYLADNTSVYLTNQIIDLTKQYNLDIKALQVAQHGKRSNKKPAILKSSLNFYVYNLNMNFLGNYRLSAQFLNDLCQINNFWGINSVQIRPSPNDLVDIKVSGYIIFFNKQ